MHRYLVAALLLAALPARPARAAETVWLSSLDLSKAQQGWGKPQADQSVDGHPLSIAGQRFERGFGTHSVGSFAIDLKGGSSRFSASVGIDDETKGHTGSVEFLVLGDGKPLWRSGVLKTGDAARTLDVDVSGVQQLLLIVTDADNGFEYDHADWAEARLEVTGARPVSAVWKQADPQIASPEKVTAPRITVPAVYGVMPGTPLHFSVPVQGGRPLTFSAKGLPAGLKLDPATGILGGVLGKPGARTMTLRAKNRLGSTEQKLRLVVGPQIALTPPLGWNSYDCFGDAVLEDEVLANARYMAKTLRPHGWEYVIVDFRWYDPAAAPKEKAAPGPLTMDAYGRLLPSPNRFPSAANGVGFKALADQVHAMGLKFGVHIMRGIPRRAVQENTPIFGSPYKAQDAANTKSLCGWNQDMYGVDGSKPAGQAWYDSIIRQYAEWGLDYIKVDDMSSPYSALEIEAIRKAIDRCGRSIVFSLSPGETPVEQAAHVKGNANLWRISGDFWDEWGPLSHMFELLARWHGVAAPGHWPDADMLPLGHIGIRRTVGSDRQTRFSRAEQLTHMTLWCLAPSPLMMGGNLPDNDAWTEALLTNDEVLAVNQDPLGKPAARVLQRGGLEAWARDLADGSKAVGLFNRGPVEGKLTVTWAELGLKGKHSARDLWLHKELGALEGRIEASVLPHSAMLIRLKAAKR